MTYVVRSRILNTPHPGHVRAIANEFQDWVNHAYRDGIAPAYTPHWYDTSALPMLKYRLEQAEIRDLMGEEFYDLIQTSGNVYREGSLDMTLVRPFLLQATDAVALELARPVLRVSARAVERESYSHYSVREQSWSNTYRQVFIDYYEKLIEEYEAVNPAVAQDLRDELGVTARGRMRLPLQMDHKKAVVNSNTARGYNPQVVTGPLSDFAPDWVMRTLDSTAAMGGAGVSPTPYMLSHRAVRNGERSSYPFMSYRAGQERGNAWAHTYQLTKL